MGQREELSPDKNRSHDLPNTGWALLHTAGNHMGLSSRSSAERAPARCSRGYGLDSGRGLVLFLNARVMLINSPFAFSLPSSKFTTFIHIYQLCLIACNSSFDLFVIIRREKTPNSNISSPSLQFAWSKAKLYKATCRCHWAGCHADVAVAGAY